MHYLYGRHWHEVLRKPVKEITESQARARWQDGPQFSVSGGSDLEVGRVPEFTLLVTQRGEVVETYRYNAVNSIMSIYTFAVTEDSTDWMFMRNVVVYLYPDDDRYYDQSRSRAHSQFTFRPDGWASRRLTVKNAPVVQVDEFTDVDVSAHWVQRITFGDWDRFGQAREPALQDEQ